MAYNENSPLTERAIPGGQLVDVSSASISYVAVPFQGVVVDAYSCISAAITGANSTVTVKKIRAGTATTLGTITIVQSGSAIGDVHRMSISGTEIECSVIPGDTLAFDSNGSSSTTSIGNFVAVIRGA